MPAGIKVIISFGYNNPNAFDIATGGFIEYIQKYKDHNAILLWELGNEYNYHPEWFGGDINIWYKTLDIAAGLIQMIDESEGAFIFAPEEIKNSRPDIMSFDNYLDLKNYLMK